MIGKIGATKQGMESPIYGRPHFLYFSVVTVGTKFSLTYHKENYLAFDRTYQNHILKIIPILTR